MGPVTRRMTPLNPVWAMQQVVSQFHPMPGTIKPEVSKPSVTQTGVSGFRNISASSSTSSLLITDRIGKPAARALSGAESIPVYATTGAQRAIYGTDDESALSGRLFHLVQDNAMRAFHFGETASIADILAASMPLPEQSATRMKIESDLDRATQTIIDNIGPDRIIRNARGEVITVWKYNPEDGSYRIQVHR